MITNRREEEIHIKQFPILQEASPVTGRSAIRAINQYVILDRIYQNDGISKAQLAKELGISKPAVSSNVVNLLSSGLVLERGEGEASASGGRKPVMLYFNEQYSYVGVLDLSFQAPVCTVCDMKYRMIGLEKIGVEEGLSTEAWRQRVKQAFLKIFFDANIPAEKLGVVIISQPGISRDGLETNYLPPLHHAKADAQLRPFLQQELAVPVIIKNNVNLAAVGEVHFGTGERLENLVYISCGTALSAGMIIQGRLYEGSHCAAGEIGFLLRYDGRHAEKGVTADALTGLAQKLYAENGKNEALSFPLIVERLNSGDPLIEQAVYETGNELGRIIQNCCVLLDISTVIFGGDYLALGPVLFKGMRDFVERTTISRHELIPSALKDTASLYGGFVVGKETILSVLMDNKI